MSTALLLPEHAINGPQILAALRAVGQGNFSTRLPLDWTGTAGEVAGAFNYVLDLLDRSTQEVERVSEVVGKQGKIDQRASVPGAAGGWAIRVESLNNLISDLVRPAPLPPATCPNTWPSILRACHSRESSCAWARL